MYPQQLKAVIFDLDGTLLDTATEFVEVVQIMREEQGLSPLPEHSIRSNVSNGARALVTLALGIAEGEPGFEQQRLHLLELYSGVLGRYTLPYAGIEDLLKELGECGIAWGIATNKPEIYTLPLLNALRLEPASVVCPNHVSHIKPHPEPLYLNCRQLGCAPHQAIYIGDHGRDIQAGRNAGMYTIAAAYGYVLDGDDPHSWGADSVAEYSTDLAQLLRAAFATRENSP